MGSGKSPAFQFYPNDWLSSTHVTLMTPAQEGAYIRLLCHAWADQDCSLPDDDAKLSVLSRLGEGWLKGGSHLVRQCFVAHPHKTGRIVNERLLLEREKQRIWREKSQAGGVKSGRTRRSKVLKATKGGSVLVEPNANQMATLQSSSSSSSSNNTPIVPDAAGLGFDEFWQSWPDHFRKGGTKNRQSCLAHWKKHGLAQIAGKIVTAVEGWKASSQWAKDEGDFIPSPLPWLRQEKYESVPPLQRPAAKSGPSDGMGNIQSLFLQGAALDAVLEASDGK